MIVSIGSTILISLGTNAHAQGTPGLVQKSKSGNFELVVSLPHGGIAHYWRDSSSNFKWHGPTARIQEPMGAFTGIEVIENARNPSKGNLEVVGIVSDQLVHFWRDITSHRWIGPTFISSGVTGAPGMTQGSSGNGNFEVVTPLSGGGLAHFWRQNDSDYRWFGPTSITPNNRNYDAADVIENQSRGSQKNLEVVARSGDELLHFWRSSAPHYRWTGPNKIASGVTGSPTIVQGNHSSRNLEVIVPLEKGGLAHFWRDSTGDFDWHGPTIFGSEMGIFAGAALIENRNRISKAHLEVVATREDGTVVHFWRSNHPSYTWTNGAIIRVGSRNIDVSVARHTQLGFVGLTQAEVDQILFNASELVGLRDSATDVSCGVIFSRSTPMRVFSDGDSFIDTAEELNQIFALPERIKVVADVNYCGRYNRSIIGCAITPGETIVVQRFPPLDDILWSHEYGHNTGLPHTPTDRHYETRVMYGSIGNNRREINAYECDRFLGNVYDITGSAVIENRVDPATIESSGVDPTLTDIVKKVYFHGLPLGQLAEDFSSNNALELLDILDDYESLAYHENSVLALGIIGGPEVADALISYIESAYMPEDPQSRDLLSRSRASAIVGLGYLVNQTGSPEGLRYLLEGLESGVWSQRLISSASEEVKEAQVQEFMKTNFFALGVSASAEARERLEALELGNTALSNEIRQSLSLMNEIEKVGLLEYYKDDHE